MIGWIIVTGIEVIVTGIEVIVTGIEVIVTGIEVGEIIIDLESNLQKF